VCPCPRTSFELVYPLQEPPRLSFLSASRDGGQQGRQEHPTSDLGFDQPASHEGKQVTPASCCVSLGYLGKSWGKCVWGKRGRLHRSHTRRLATTIAARFWFPTDECGDCSDVSSGKLGGSADRQIHLTFLHMQLRSGPGTFRAESDLFQVRAHCVPWPGTASQGGEEQEQEQKPQQGRDKDGRNGNWRKPEDAASDYTVRCVARSHVPGRRICVGETRDISVILRERLTGKTEGGGGGQRQREIKIKRQGE
jgi:hypothetical protein